MGALHIGTSGFVYKHWRRIFYPEDVPAPKWLQYYARTFSTVELNTTFYRLPTVEAVQGWRKTSPAGFLFACKGSRFLTHMKKLKDPVPSLQLYFERIHHLSRKLGPVVWQLPPQMAKVDLPRLEEFLAALPRKVRHAVEFRTPAWYTDEVCDLLDRYHVAFCEHDLVDRPPPRFTGSFRYLRFHGFTGKYQGRYGRHALRPTAESLIAWRERGNDAYAYFNNDIGGHALSDALDLLELTARPAAAPLGIEPAAADRTPP